MLAKNKMGKRILQSKLYPSIASSYSAKNYFHSRVRHSYVYMYKLYRRKEKERRKERRKKEGEMKQKVNMDIFIFFLCSSSPLFY